MPRFAYKAIDEHGRPQRGQLEAANLTDLDQRLARMQLSLIRAKPQAAAQRRGRPLSRRDLIDLCFQIEQLTRAGVPIHDALADLRDSLPPGRLREAVAGLTESIGGGGTLSQAMDAQPTQFPAVFRGLIAVGELTGQLPRVAAQLIDSQKREDELAAYARRLTIYPAIMLSVIVGALALSLAYLVPQLSTLFRSLGQTLPAHTRLLITASELATQYGHWALAALVSTGLIARWQIQHNARFAHAADGALLRLPLLGPALKKITLARFAGVFGLMYSAGIPIIDCLRAGEQTAGNRVLRDAIADARMAIESGHSLSHAFARTGLFPPLIIRMLHVGESTGALDVALTNVNYFFDRDVREGVARVQAGIEPVLTLVLGGVLLWVMLSVLGPVYDLLSRIKF